MPGDAGVTVVTNSRVFFTTREAAGAAGARHSLRPLMFRERDVQGKTRVDCAARSRSRGYDNGCCLKIESVPIHCVRTRHSSSSLRTQGPITTNVRGWNELQRQLISK